MDLATFVKKQIFQFGAMINRLMKWSLQLLLRNKSIWCNDKSLDEMGLATFVKKQIFQFGAMINRLMKWALQLFVFSVHYDLSFTPY